ncbi:MAG TPA: hypothetical protein PKG60_07420 [Spirochaetota bacterium]|mgnify:CR=1 FL=1|nr:hypothetical protein [Spirochaetota bacterium]HPS86360.1 hypothetical protein [Spirochaetota bacterium]
MAVQNISGADIISTNFTPEYTPKNEQIPTDQTREAPRERPAEENKGQKIDAVA